MYDFYKDLEFSRGSREFTDLELLKNIIPNCVSVTKTDVETDKKGIDYIATLQDGAQVFIDGKRRRNADIDIKTGTPVLALEIWSVKPMLKNGKKVQKPGWTWSTSTNVDMILYTFENSDSCYLVPFQFLRMAFQKNYRKWKQDYKPRTQKNKGYNSECMFVPAKLVLDAVAEQMTHGI